MVCTRDCFFHCDNNNCLNSDKNWHYGPNTRRTHWMLCQAEYYRKLHCNEKKEEILLSPMSKAHLPTGNSKRQSDHKKNTTKQFEFTTIEERVRTTSRSDYRYPTVVVYLFAGLTLPLLTTFVLSKGQMSSRTSFQNMNYETNRNGEKNSQSYNLNWF